MWRKTIPVLLIIFIAACLLDSDGNPVVKNKGTRTVDSPGALVADMAGISSLVSTGTSAANIAARAYEMDFELAAGIKHIRHEFHWNRIEPTQGNFNFAGYDIMVIEADNRGLELMGLLCYGAPWAASDSGGDPKYPPDDVEDFANYVKLIVARYKDKIEYWEIWNEQNLERFWKPGPDPEAYGYLLKAAADAIRSADPDAKIVLGGLAPLYSASWESMWGFLEETYAFHPDLGDYFDVLAIHTYTFIQLADPETDNPGNMIQQSIPRMVSDAKDAMVRWEGKAKPIVITEVGWYTSPGDPIGTVSDEDQARYLVRSFILAAAEGVIGYYWYTFRDNSDHLTDSEDAFGLVGYDPDPTDGTPPVTKMSGLTYAAMIDVLGDTRYSSNAAKRLGLGPNVYAYVFNTDDGSKSVTVVWTTGDTAIPVDVPVKSGMSEFTMVDMLGTATVPAPANGSLTVNATRSPVYVVQEK